MIDMRVISNKTLIDFAQEHPGAQEPLQAWRRVVENSVFRHYADLKWTFNSVDRVGDYYVFDICGNRYRLITAIHFNRQMLFIREVLTHKAYESWRP
jgi:mRNA interferase HigB